jgi:sulfur relay (sulfurtransferase) DsrC/TusE family protein
MLQAQAVCDRILVCLFLTFVGAGSARAHEHGELLSHHWEIPTYIREIHFQMGLMAAAALAIAVIKLVRSLKGSNTRR